MGRPRKAAVDAHIAGYSLPHFEDADWEDLEQIARVTLNDVARTAIHDAAGRYTEETLLQRDGAARAKMVDQALTGRKLHKKVPPLAAFRDSLGHVITAWRNAGLDPETARLIADIAAEIKHQSKGRLDLGRTLIDLELITHSLNLHLERIAKSVQPIGGPSTRKAPSAHGNRPSLEDPFNSLVGRLAKIFTAAGGKVTAPTLTDSSKRTSLFVALVMRVNDNLPESAKIQRATKAAWSKAVARALPG